MNSISSQGEAPKENITFVKEIQMMMFGLGDCSTPLLTTASVIEEIVLEQLLMIIGQAEEIAEKRGVDGIFPQDILFLMRKDMNKLNRILNFIAFKEMKKGYASVLNEADKVRIEELPSTLELNHKDSKRKLMCLQFLQSIGVQLDDEAVDDVKQERLRKADQRVQNMSQKTYEEFNLSRRQTFLGAKLSSVRLLDWLRQHCPDCAPKLKFFTIDLLLYLCKETIAQLIDIALLLRQDSSVQPDDPFSRTPQPCLPFETFGPSTRQLEGPPPITVAEIQEVMRRFFSTQLCPWGLFTANIDPLVFNRILAF